ncbi:hypothetical protein D3Y79_02375 [Listeria monocytogenes]|nr:hypothetical protein [Listeria monocytogenes]
MSSIGKIVNIECYFCADDLDKRCVEIDGTNGAEAKIDEDNDLSFTYYDNYSSDDYHMFLSIEFCPMCGRKLEVEKG